MSKKRITVEPFARCHLKKSQPFLRCDIKKLCHMKLYKEVNVIKFINECLILAFKSLSLNTHSNFGNAYIHINKFVQPCCILHVFIPFIFSIFFFVFVYFVYFIYFSINSHFRVVFFSHFPENISGLTIESDVVKWKKNVTKTNKNSKAKQPSCKSDLLFNQELKKQ